MRRLVSGRTQHLVIARCEVIKRGKANEKKEESGGF
jgi:hypothetical protein